MAIATFTRPLPAVQAPLFTPPTFPPLPPAWISVTQKNGIKRGLSNTTTTSNPNTRTTESTPTSISGNTKTTLNIQSTSSYPSCAPEGLDHCSNIYEELSQCSPGNELCLCDKAMDLVNCEFEIWQGNGCFDEFVSYVGVDPAEIQSSLLAAGYCTGDPASVYETAIPPSTVSMAFDTIQITTLTTPPTITSSTSTTPWPSTGNLLSGPCTSESFTLLHDNKTAYWAPMVGCDANRPECCPWAVSTSANPITVTVTTTDCGMHDASKQQYPEPANAAQSVLRHCPEDYYTVSGRTVCCPIGHFLFTTAIGGTTPCYSSLNTPLTSPPPLTAGLDFIPDCESYAITTRAVLNIALSIPYDVHQPSGGLSKGAIVGIAVGAAAIVIIIVVLIVLLWSKKNRARGRTASATDAATLGGTSNMLRGEKPAPPQVRPLGSPSGISSAGGPRELTRSTAGVAIVSDRNGRGGQTVVPGYPQQMQQVQYTANNPVEMTGEQQWMHRGPGVSGTQPYNWGQEQQPRYSPLPQHDSLRHDSLQHYSPQSASPLSS